MKKVALFASIVVATLVVAAPAQAFNHSRRKIVKLERTTRSLRVQLRAVREQLAGTQATLTGTQTQLADVQTQLASERAQVASTNSLLVQAQHDRDAARSQVAAMQTKLAEIPSPLSVAFTQVQHEVAWAQHWNAPYSYGRLVAQAALDYTLGHVNPGAYGYLLMTNSPLAAVTPDGILSQQAGICGHASLVFAAIVHHFGLPVRRVNFYYTNWLGQPGGHTTDEVFYDGDWHFFDPMYGLYYQDANGNPVSIAEARSDPGSVTERRDFVSFANLIDAYKESFELDPVTTVQYIISPSTVWGG